MLRDGFCKIYRIGGEQGFGMFTVEGMWDSLRAEGRVPGYGFRAG